MIERKLFYRNDFNPYHFRVSGIYQHIEVAPGNHGWNLQYAMIASNDKIIPDSLGMLQMGKLIPIFRKISLHQFLQRDIIGNKNGGHNKIPG